jgi:hypothetical protein
MKFCPNCGTELKPEAKFCIACGKSIVETSVPPLVQTSQPKPDYVKEEPVYEQAREATHAFTEAITGKTNLIQRAINTLTKPKEEWSTIATEKPETMKLIGGYALILALIPAVSMFIKYGIIGSSFMGFTTRSISTGIHTGLVQLLTALIGVYVLAWVIDQLAPSFEAEKNFGRSLQLAVYASTPQWVAGILFLFSTSVSMLVLLCSMYAVYLLAVGLPVLNKTPKDKVVGYVVLTIIAMILIGLILSFILDSVLGLFFVGSMS